MKIIEKYLIRPVLLAGLSMQLTLVASCSTKQSDSIDPEIVGTPVQVIHPFIRDFQETVDLDANTVFLQKETIRATFDGFMGKILKNIGDSIHPGDTLLTMRTKESLSGESVGYNLSSGLFSGIVQVKAHSKGILTELNYHSGDFVSTGEQLTVISNPASLSIMLNVPYQFASRIQLGNQCEIQLPDSQSIPAIIKRIIPSVDPTAQTQTFLLQPEQNISLPENLNLNARVTLNTIKDAVGLPRSAVMSNETQTSFWVMRVVDDTLAIRTEIGKGLESDSLIQIVNPTLSVNDLIISDGAYGLPDSTKIKIVK